MYLIYIMYTLKYKNISRALHSPLSLIEISNITLPESGLETRTSRLTAVFVNTRPMGQY